MGAKPANVLQSLFETLASGGEPTPAGFSNMDRFIRMGAGIAVATIGWATHANWIWLILGGVLMFSTVYNRCPIRQALTSQFKKLNGQA